MDIPVVRECGPSAHLECPHVRVRTALIERLRVALAERPPHSEAEVSLLDAANGAFLRPREIIVAAMQFGATAEMFRAAADVLEDPAEAAALAAWRALG